MPKALTWKIGAARAELQNIAKDIAEFFNIPAPKVYQPDYRKGADWQVRIDQIQVWTKAGPAKLAVDISPRFAHLFFRFYDTECAAFLVSDWGRLNQYSGKWNRHACPDSWALHGKPCPETSLNVFRAELRRDFRRVAEPNPDPAEVSAHLHELESRAARLSEYLESLATCKADSH